MEQCCHFLAGAPKCYWELLDELQQPICMIVGPSFAGFLDLWPIINMEPPEVFSISITLVDVYLNWLNWFHFLILKGVLLVILIDCVIDLSLFLDVTRMSLPAVSFFAQPDPGILYL